MNLEPIYQFKSNSHLFAKSKLTDAHAVHLYKQTPIESFNEMLDDSDIDD